MIPTVAVLSLAGAVLVALAIGTRIYRGTPVDAAVVHLRVGWLLCAIPLAVACILGATAEVAQLPAHVGLREVGGALNAVSRVGALRAALYGLAAATVLAALVAPGLLRSSMLVVTRHVGDLVVAARADLRDMVRDPKVAVIIGMLILLGAAARWPLMTLPISYDEAITFVWFASRTPADVISDYSIPNNHILHNLGVHYSALILGGSEMAVRLPAFLAGVLIIPVGAWLVWARFGAAAAVLQAALLASAPPLVEYSAQGRGYTLAALLLLLAMLSLHYAIESRRQAGWAMYALFLALALNTVTTMVMACYFIGAWVLLHPDRRRILAAFVLASLAGGALTVVLYTPAVLRVGLENVVAPPDVGALPMEVLVARWAATLGGVRSCWAGAIPSPGALALPALLFVGATVARPHRWEGGRIVAALVAMCAVVLLLHRTAPPVRTLLPLFPLLSTVLAAGGATLLARPARRYWWLVPTVAVSGATAWIVARDRVVVRAEAAALERGIGPRADGVNLCAEGFVGEAQAAARWAREATSEGAPIVVHQFSGLSAPLRFYLLGEGVPLRHVHPFTASVSLRQLDWYDRVYVMSRFDGDSVLPLDRAARELRVDASDVAESYEARAVDAGLRHIAIVELVPRGSRPVPIAGETPRINVLDYPRTVFRPVR